MAESRQVAIGVVGTGALGRHHVRLLAEIDGADLRGVYDIRPEVGVEVAGAFGTRSFPDLESLVAEVEAVVLAVPTTDHAELGCRLLAAGKHVLVEKPMASSLEEADRLLAAAGDRVLAVGHVEFYNPAVQAVLGLGGPPGFAEVHRMAPFTPRSLDIDVVLDLMIHDIQILQAMDASPLVEVRATGVRVLSDKVDMANARFAFESGCVANLTASRVSAERLRKLRVFLPRSYYSVDYQEQSVNGFRLEESDGGRTIAPAPVAVEQAEPLRRELEAFLARCCGREVPWVGGADGRRALATATRVVEALGRPG